MSCFFTIIIMLIKDGMNDGMTTSKREKIMVKGSHNNR
jgi:hypothetical protein